MHDRVSTKPPIEFIVLRNAKKVQAKQKPGGNYILGFSVVSAFNKIWPLRHQILIGWL